MQRALTVRSQQQVGRNGQATRRAVLRVETLEARMLLSVSSLQPQSIMVVGEPDPATVTPVIVAGDPSGTPPDTPADRVDPNTTGSLYAGVGSLFMDAGGGSGFICSGTLISPTVVLTAAHCLDSDGNGTIDFAPEDVLFVLNYGSSYSHIITASALTIHPDFTGFNNPSVLDDLAIIELSSAVPLGVPIYEIDTTPPTGTETITMVGYGTTGDGVNGYIDGSASFNIKRTGMNHADVYNLDDEGSGATEGFEWDFDGSDDTTNLFGSDIPFNLTLGNDIEAGVGGGDSGGPSFVDDGNGSLLLFGVNTYTFDFLQDAPLFGSGGGGIVVSAYADWIESFLDIPSSTVVGRNIFYNNSVFDANNPLINASDDGAIAPDKTAYLPGDGLAVYSNITNYDKGINGVMIDLDGGGDHASITASDFVFKTGSNNAPDLWNAAPAPTAVTVRLGAGVSGSDRVEITWADGAMTNTYLAVGVLPNANTGLAATTTMDPDGAGGSTAVDVGDVFFWGNKVGEVTDPAVGGTFFTAVTQDGSAIIANSGFLVGITNRFDIGKNNSVTVVADRGAVIANAGFLPRIDISGSGPFAPIGDSVERASARSGETGIALSLAAVLWGPTTSQSGPHSINDWTPDDGPAVGTNAAVHRPIETVGLWEIDDEAEDLDTQLDDDLLEALASSLDWLGGPRPEAWRLS